MNSPPDTLPVSFSSIIVRSDIVDRHYRGGLSAFDERYDDAKRTAELRLLSYMSPSYAEDELEHLERNGLHLRQHLALADMILGELFRAPGIEFRDVSHGPVPHWLVSASQEVAR